MPTKDKTSILPPETPRLPTGDPEPTGPAMQRSARDRSVLNTPARRGNFEVAPAESNTTARPLSSQKTPNGPPKTTDTTTHINPAGPSKTPTEGGYPPTTVDPQPSSVEATPNGPPKKKETTVTYYKTTADAARSSPVNISGTTSPKPPVTMSPELPPSTIAAMFGPDISTTTPIDQNARTYKTVDSEDRPTSTYSDRYGDVYPTTEGGEIKTCDKPSEVTSSTVRSHQHPLTDANDDGEVRTRDTPTTADSTAEPDSVYQIATASVTGPAATEPDSVYSVETPSSPESAAEPDSVYSVFTASATMVAEPDSVYSIASATVMAAAEPDSVYNVLTAPTTTMQTAEPDSVYSIATLAATVSIAAEPDSVYNIATPLATISIAAEPDSVYNLPTSTSSTSASASGTFPGAPVSMANKTAITTAFTRPGVSSALYGTIVAGADDLGRDGVGPDAPPLPFMTPGGTNRGVGVGVSVPLGTGVTGTLGGGPVASPTSSMAMGLLAGRMLVTGLSGK